MPREQITHNRIIDRPIPDGPHYPDGHPGQSVRAVAHVEIPRRNVHVSWNRIGWVQVAVDIPLGELRSALEDAEREAAAAGKANEHIGEYSIEHHPVKIVSSELERHEINKTIATLRRARDSAYGRDE